MERRAGTSWPILSPRGLRITITIIMITVMSATTITTTTTSTTTDQANTIAVTTDESWAEPALMVEKLLVSPLAFG